MFCHTVNIRQDALPQRPHPLAIQFYPTVAVCQEKGEDFLIGRGRGPEGQTERSVWLCLRGAKEKPLPARAKHFFEGSAWAWMLSAAGAAPAQACFVRLLAIEAARLRFSGRIRKLATQRSARLCPPRRAGFVSRPAASASLPTHPHFEEALCKKSTLMPPP